MGEQCEGQTKTGKLPKFIARHPCKFKPSELEVTFCHCRSTTRVPSDPAMEGSEELLNEVSCWDLSSDAKLLEALNRFSTSICQKSKAFRDTVDNLHYNTVEAECNLRNTFNEFLTLADTQFIENVRFRFNHI